MINTTNITYLNLSKNNLGDDSLMMLADSFFDYDHSFLEKIDFSSCRIGDQGLIYFLEKCNNSP